MVRGLLLEDNRSPFSAHSPSLHVHVCEYSCLCVYVYVEAIGQCWVYFLMISTLILETGSFTDPEAHQSARLASQQALEAACLCITGLLCLGFHMGPQGSNSGPHAGVASTFPVKQFPSPCSWSLDHGPHCPLEKRNMEKDFPVHSVPYKTQRGWEEKQEHVDAIII